MSIYGEGLYRSADGRLFEDVQRQRTTGGSWDPVDEEGRPLTPLPTPESKRPALSSVYEINKYVQERLTLTLTAAHGMEGVPLRLRKLNGQGQARATTYLDCVAIVWPL